MADFLSSNVWQGIGVICSLLMGGFGLFFSRSIGRRLFKAKNSKFSKSAENPKELIEGQATTLYGKVRDEVFPGPPNYESINNGDKPLFYWILYVNEPISLVGRSPEDNQLYEKGTSCMFQLVLTEEIYDNRLDILGKYVKADGEIFLGHTGYHNTKALLEVNSIRVIK